MEAEVTFLLNLRYCIEAIARYRQNIGKSVTSDICPIAVNSKRVLFLLHINPDTAFFHTKRKHW